MALIIDQKIFEKYPTFVAGVLVAKNIDNTRSALPVQEKLRQEEQRIRAEYTTDTLSEQPSVAAWKKVYTELGFKPKENRSSIENLYRLVLAGKNLRSINPLVDVYNLISLKYALTAGGEDLDAVQGDVLLTFAGPNEPPVLLLGDKEARMPKPGEVIYKDDVSAICRRWNWREADRTKLTDKTKNCILVLESVLPDARREIQRATQELKELVQPFCSGTLHATLLSKEQTRWGF